MTSPEPQYTPQQVAEAAVAKMFAEDKASAMLGIELAEVGPGHAVMTMTVREDMVNGFGILHGGLAFTLADTAFAAACNSDNRLTVAQSCDVDFVNPGRLGDRLTATCEESHKRGRSGVYDVTVVNQDGVRIALFRGRSRTIGDLIEPAYPQV